MSGGPPQLVGSGRQDTMGFTVAGLDHFLAFGRPAPGEGGPPHLGLIESTDAGTTWTTRSRAGQADFHALRFRHDTVCGCNCVTGQLIVSTDKTSWQARTTIAVRDLDVSPTDVQTLLAHVRAGQVCRRGDGISGEHAEEGSPARDALRCQARRRRQPPQAQTAGPPRSTSSRRRYSSSSMSPRA